MSRCLFGKTSFDKRNKEKERKGIKGGEVMEWVGKEECGEGRWGREGYGSERVEGKKEGMNEGDDRDEG